jgi:hypothetical protein
MLNCPYVADRVSKHPNVHIRMLDWNDTFEANPQGVFTNGGVHIVISADTVVIFSQSLGLTS